jgi:hypothetical protein
MPRIPIRNLDGPCNEPDAIIADGVRMGKEDLEHLLAVLDPAEDPDTWEYYHRKYQALIARNREVSA